MAKVLVETTGEKTRVPFLRGILTRSLQDAGINFDDALEFATAIRSELEDVPVITTTDLEERIINRLTQSFRPDLVQRYKDRNRCYSIQVYRLFHLPLFTKIERIWSCGRSPLAGMA